MAKERTRKEVERMKEKAVRFVDNALDDPDRADEIEDESIESYAERKRIQLVNPARKGNTMPAQPTKADLLDRIAELEDENSDLSDQLDAIQDIVAGDDDDDDDDDNGDVESKPYSVIVNLPG
jgi:hypothetical protein